jgi:hypothetical protein
LAREFAMDSSLASAFIASSAGQFQQDFAAKMLAMNVDAARSVAKLIDAAQQNIASLANVSAGIGTNVDITV